MSCGPDGGTLARNRARTGSVETWRASRMRMTRLGWTILFLSLTMCGVLSAQDTAPTPAPTPGPGQEAAPPTEKEPSPLDGLKEPKAFRPIEANVIINLPS